MWRERREKGAPRRTWVSCLVFVSKRTVSSRLITPPENLKDVLYSRETASRTRITRPLSSRTSEAPQPRWPRPGQPTVMDAHQAMRLKWPMVNKLTFKLISREPLVGFPFPRNNGRNPVKDSGTRSCLWTKHCMGIQTVGLCGSSIVMNSWSVLDSRRWVASGLLATSIQS